MFKGFHPEIRKPIKNVCTPPVAFQNRKLSEILLSSSLLAVDTPHPVSGSWPVNYKKDPHNLRGPRQGPTDSPLQSPRPRRLRKTR